MLITKKPSEYLEKLHMDTVVYHPPAIICAYQTVGAKQLLFGSDAPPLLPLLPRAKKIIEDFPFSDAEREDILAETPSGYWSAAKATGRSPLHFDV